MQYLSFPPHPALQPYISHYANLVVGLPNQVYTAALVPPGCAVMGVIVGGKEVWHRSGQPSFFKADALSFTGQITHYREVQFLDQYEVFYIVFKPWGAYKLLGVGQMNCQDASLNLTDLLHQREKDLLHILEDCQTITAIREVVEQFFLRLLLRQKHTYDISDRVAHIVNNIIQQCHEPMLIRKICKEEGISKSTLERHMKEVVGLTPKQFQRITRFNTVLRHIKQQKNIRHWTEIAYHFGYYDQAHFIKEFKLFLGKKPSAYSTNEVLLSDVVA